MILGTAWVWETIAVSSNNSKPMNDGCCIQVLRGKYKTSLLSAAASFLPHSILQACVIHTSVPRPLLFPPSFSKLHNQLAHENKVSNILNMATATNIMFEMAAHSLSIDTPASPPQNVDTTTDAMFEGLGATEWTELIRGELQNMVSGDSLNPKCLSAPRRRHAHPDNASLAVQIAAQLYPAPIDSSIPQVIKYEKGMFSPSLYSLPALLSAGMTCSGQPC